MWKEGENLLFLRENQKKNQNKKMPLKKGKSKKVISKNIEEMQKNPSAQTKKAAQTYAKKNKVPYKEALGTIAKAASENTAKKSKRNGRGARKHQ